MQSQGLPETQLRSGASEQNGDVFCLRRMFGLGMTTPRAMTQLMALIARRKAASPDACDKMLRMLSPQH